jgi:hypothetical protein
VLASHLLPEARAGPGSQKGPRLFFGILHDKAHIADAVNATVITLDEAPQGYKDFDKGAAKKYVSTRTV